MSQIKLPEKRVLVLGTGKMGTDYLGKLLHLGIEPGRILGVDANPEKFNFSADAIKKYPSLMQVPMVGNRHDQPLSKFVDFSQFGSVILCTNTPSHHRLLVELMDSGMRNIFCEKPLALNMDGVNDIRKAKLATKSEIFTAFLINLSEAVMHLIGRMKEEDLVLVQGEASWGKNRMYDTRATPGDLEDESVHPIGVFHTLLEASGQEIDEINVRGRLSYLDYIDPMVQQKAHNDDPSFPLIVNSSAFIIEELRSTSIPFPVLLQTSSSYVKGKQVRRVEVTLAKRSDPAKPVLAVEFNFDTKQGDVLEITQLQEKVVEEPLYFTGDKVAMETSAFMRFVTEGYRDPRLTGYLKAQMSVKVTDAIMQSDRLSGAVVRAIGLEDVQLRRAINA
jgi:predicted dehydrogenase